MPLRLPSLLLSSCLLLAACGPSIHGTWHASHPRGDDPAIAIELVRDGKKFSGTMFLLDANTPGDFSSGTRYPMTIKSADDHEIRYSVEFLAHEPDHLILRLSQPTDGASFHAVMVMEDGRGEPMEFDFARVGTK